MEDRMSAHKHSEPFLSFRLFGVILLFAVGVFTITQPYLGIYEGSTVEFLSWLHGIGFVFVFHSILLLVAHVFHKAEDKESFGLSIIFSSIYFIMLFRLFSTPETVPIASYESDQWALLEDSEFKESLVRILVGSVMAMVLLGIVHSFRHLIPALKKSR